MCSFRESRGKALARHTAHRSAVGLTVPIMQIDAATVEVQVVGEVARVDSRSRRPVIAVVARTVDLPVEVIVVAGKTKVKGATSHFSRAGFVAV